MEMENILGKEITEMLLLLHDFISNYKSFVILYFIIGFMLMLLYIIKDMRGEEFNENYFEYYFENEKTDLVLILFFWFPILIIALLYFIYVEIVLFLKDKLFITRLLYKIANIGINKGDQYKSGISGGYTVIPEDENSHSCT